MVALVWELGNRSHPSHRAWRPCARREAISPSFPPLYWGCWRLYL